MVSLSLRLVIRSFKKSAVGMGESEMSRGQGEFPGGGYGFYSVYRTKSRISGLRKGHTLKYGAPVGGVQSEFIVRCNFIGHTEIGGVQPHKAWTITGEQSN